ncbi:putative membrane protein DUF2207 [Ilumatobacter fluminis]|uniref:Putative membrane protein DUF2207 n=1 Tax=Ilumatobacter fluminis TaxID=467091 RepID=A0A4R7HWW2_9ACTN|nr:DUF2207 domain-containing protein [Ilumatobacter fluminis]TDT14666.1 putative membrane protein DUF2207 [Ilumatobacter fluminis]
MGMIGKISPLRHLSVGVAVVGTTVLTATGIIGGGAPEKYDQWQSVVEPAGADGVRLTHVIDQDFGSNDRRGHETYIPNDFGEPVDITAESPDAPDAVTATDFGIDTRIRIGEVNTFITGQHRYTLAYTLPEAKLDTGILSLDVLGDDGAEIDEFELVVTGWVLGDPLCFVGAAGSSNQCELVESEDGFYRWTVDGVGENQGVTVEGDILGSADVVSVEPPPLPERRTTYTGVLTLAVLALGVIGGGGTFLWARRKGRNEVFAGGAAEAAYGKMPPPGSAAMAGGTTSTELITDARMADLATIEFVPPKGLAPWQGRVLLDEHADSGTIEAWLSGLAGMEAIEIVDDGKNMIIKSGPKRELLSPDDERLLDALLQGGQQYTTGKFNSKFAAAWSAIGAHQKQQLAQSGWWKHLPPGSGLGTGGSSGSPFGLIMVFVFIMIWSGSIFTAVIGWFQNPVMALIVGLVFPTIVAYFMYRVLLPARSAVGSALALRTESFRRFLHESEGHHVEWAWEHGVLREYSGWAVALGEADAWSRALERANVPPPARMSATPIIIANRMSSVQSSYTKPSSSSGGSGGFRGGSVGGGGGGGSRGSW